MKPDVVYVARRGQQNEELRYSLRSLQNLPHGKVWIFGHAPSWVTEAKLVHVAARHSGPRGAKTNLLAALNHPDVSEEFYYFNDDFFVMQPFDQLPVLHRGPLSHAIGSRKYTSSYTLGLSKVAKALAKRGITEPLMYDLHAPMLVTKTGMAEALSLCQANMQERTMYGNLHALGGELARNYKARRSEQGWQSWPLLSTNDETFRTHAFGVHIRNRFPDRSEYETTAPPTPKGYRVVRHRVRVAA